MTHIGNIDTRNEDWLKRHPPKMRLVIDPEAYRRIRAASKIVKHAAHDQSSHGNWARGIRAEPPLSKPDTRGNQLFDGTLDRRTGERRSEHWPPLASRLGDCYMNAGQILITEEATLVHGIIRAPEGDVAHAWVELDDGYIYEPTSDAVYHPDDFEALHDPVVLATYESTDAMAIMMREEHWGPYDSNSMSWYDTYHELIMEIGHQGASKAATKAALGE